MKPVRLIVNRLSIAMTAAALGIGAEGLYALPTDDSDDTMFSSSETISQDTHSGELVFSGTVITPTCQIVVTIDGKAPTTDFSAQIPFENLDLHGKSVNPGEIIPGTDMKTIALEPQCTHKENAQVTITLTGTAHNSLSEILTDESKTNIGVKLTLSDGTSILGVPSGINVTPTNKDGNKILLASSLVATDKQINAGDFQISATYTLIYK